MPKQPAKPRAGWSRRNRQPSITSLDALWEGFFYNLRVKRRSHNTLAYYAVTQRMLGRFTEEYPHWPRDMQDLTVQHLRAFSVWLERGAPDRKPCGPGGLHAHVRAVKALMTWAYREELLARNPAERYERPKLPRKRLPSVTPEQAQKVFRQAKETDQPRRDLALVRVLYDSGLRVSELCDLKLADLDPARGLLTVQSGKGDKSRTVPLGTRAFSALAAYLQKERDPLHEGIQHVFLARTGRPLGTSGVAQRLEMIAQACRLNKSDITPHAFRRGFAVEYLRQGGDVFTLQTIMGHVSLDMTRRYVQYLDEDLKSAHLRFSPGDRLTGR
ncbi:tyrosine recombinase XerC [Deinococcus xinjiangensis]|uniref:Tyrosine recombinase XerC n=1 Tax=Deinococcus xinjiangensis TaxID=457454 RepID=A0ABP9V6V1_9DEIO